uniref:Acetylglutamate kinase n=1 Tax=Sonderella linearis TaxID=110477 RepID=A0A1Z1MM44_9FLOR|nr:acetylglutamate kinase [Sonderella linearis]ARW67108.1 acetylglutamate kinase [Sonderella linearis]
MSNTLISNRFNYLSDALPFLTNYCGSTFVIKYGGSVMKNNFLKSKFVDNICFLQLCGINIVIVHGGGFFINECLLRFNIEPKFNDGIRITDPDTMEIVEMVLMGKVNPDLVSLFNKNNLFSIGLSGKDANLIQASPLFNSVDNLTGKVDYINNRILNLLLSRKCIPIIGSVAYGIDSRTYNINADTCASAIASSLKADKLILLTDTPGVLNDINDSSSIIKLINLSDIEKLKSDNVISGGMIPKVESCICALESGVSSTHIIDGRLENSLLHELLTDARIGSMIVS